MVGDLSGWVPRVRSCTRPLADAAALRHAARGLLERAVAYYLYITDVDAIARGLLFERFLSPERAERPDIDLN